MLPTGSLRYAASTCIVGLERQKKTVVYNVDESYSHFIGQMDFLKIEST